MSAFAAPADDKVLEQFAAAGVTRALLLLPPEGAVERVAYFALAPNFQTARAYACLKDCQ